MFKWIDTFLDKITMYRVVLYEVIALILFAIILAFFHFIPYQPLSILFSTLFITVVCLITNVLCAKIYKAPTNVESVYITAIILALIISPPHAPFDTAYFSLAIWASIWAMASKYIFAIGNKHIFNPAAFAVALTALALNQSASWWVGTPMMFPAVLIGGFLIIKKIHRFDLVGSFLAASLLLIIGSGIVRGVSIVPFVLKTLTQTPIFFFASVMLTEPLTSPPTKQLRILYGAVVGFLFAPWIHIGTFFSTPELALIAGNIFSYAVSPKQKLILTLKRKVEEANQTIDFIFRSDRKMNFRAGQYLEWTLAHENSDSRGNRRYFTIASSPTEEEIHLGVKFYPKGSSFKNTLSAMEPGDKIIASQLTGDFVLPKRTDQKIAFIAGGIGVTPFRSMIKDMVDKNEPRDVVMFYVNKTAYDIAYSPIFNEAETIGIKTVYVLTDLQSIPKEWNGRTGMLDAKMIQEEIPDYREREFYLSGPHGMVVAYDTLLKQMGVPSNQIKKDFFPGFA